MKLTVEHLVVNRGDRRVIDDLTFCLKKGETLTLLGPNGVGKTTLLRALAGFIAPLSGKVRLDNGDIEEDKPVGESCHFVGHANGLKSSLSVIENLQFWSAYLNDDRSNSGDTSCHEALKQFNLVELSEIPCGYLSAGQKRRLGLARLVVARRPLWLLDEPTVSLDALSVRLLGKAVASHVACGGMVIAATHIPLGLENTKDLHLAIRESVQ